MRARRTKEHGGYEKSLWAMLTYEGGCEGDKRCLANADSHAANEQCPKACIRDEPPLRRASVFYDASECGQW